MAINLDRNKILDEARKQFARMGLKKTSLIDIARPLGVGKTAIYHHFPGGKRELMEQVMRHEEEVLLSHIRTEVGRESDPLKQLKRMITSKLDHGQRLRELLDVPKDVGEEIASIYADRELSFNREELAMIKAIIERGMETGVLRRDDPLHLASVLQMMARRIEMTLVFEMSPKTMKQRIDDLFEILFYGIVSDAEHRSAHSHMAGERSKASFIAPASGKSSNYKAARRESRQQSPRRAVISAISNSQG
ncbi:MAG: TetR/AcrR family transcriptional regulator [Syntrophaceae bacterium]